MRTLFLPASPARLRRISYCIAGLALIVAALACNISTTAADTPTTLTEVADVTDEATEERSDEADETEEPSDADDEEESEAEDSDTIATDTPTPTIAPGVTPSATTCTYNAKFEADVTIPDGTDMVAGQAFTKTWRLRNTGCQSWPSGTQLVFLDGNQMGGPAGVPVAQTAENATQDVSVNLTAPNTAGSYQGRWQLRSSDGIAFGDKVFVKIDVIEPSPTPTLTPTLTLTPTETDEPVVVVPVFDVDFNVTYISKWKCGTGGRVTFYVNNTGSLAIESATYYLEGPIGTELTSATTNTLFRSAPQLPHPDCAPSGLSSLAAGDSAYMWTGGSPPAIPNLAGKLTIKMCSADSNGGICKEKVFTFIY